MLNSEWYLKTPRVNLAARALSQGGVIAYPTEGVWGLGCDPENIDAVDQILRLKSRPVSKGLILVTDSISSAERFVVDMPALPNSATPTTWLVDHGGRAPDWITGGSSKLAIRVSQHPLVAALCKALDSPIVSTSANPSGKQPAKSAGDVRRYFGDLIDIIVNGPLGNQTGASQIIDWDTKEILRQSER